VAQQTQGTIEIEASPEEIIEVVADFDTYPEWVDGIKAAAVRERGDDGRPTLVDFEFAAMGFNASYTLRYEYSDTRVSWSTVEASGAVKDVQGEYVLEPLNGDTEVTYRLAIEPAVKLPGLLRRQADKRALKAGLDGLKSRVESR
jgi:ribosome-associated toxin RatA of RatAB toxin-antitoxin module